MKLELGSGKHPTKGYDHFDINPKCPHVEYTSFAVLEDNTYKEIYARHVLEHMTQIEARLTLDECKRILKPKGKIHIIVPNLEFHVKQLKKKGKSPYSKASNHNHGMAGLYGWQRSPYDIHKWGYTKKTLKDLLKIIFKNVKFVDCRECDLEVWAVK